MSQPTAPAIGSVAYFAQVLAEAEKAHAAYVQSLTAKVDDRCTLGVYVQRCKDVAAEENANWPTFYAKFIATRIVADARAEQATPIPQPPYPGYAEDVRCTNCGTTLADLQADNLWRAKDGRTQHATCCVPDQTAIQRAAEHYAEEANVIPSLL